MYEYLDVPFQRIRLIWVYTKASATSQHDLPAPEDAETMPGNYFVYGKRLHEMLLLSPHFWTSSLRQILQTLYIAICHIWFFAACFIIQPQKIQSQPYVDVDSGKKISDNGESFRQYLERIRLPNQYAVYYLLPVLSVICSCSHAEMMDFPASDVTSFVKGSFLRETYVSQGGINRVQSKLAKGISDIRLRTRVTKVDRVDEGILIRWERTEDGKISTSEEMFDRVVLAVSPNVTAAIFSPSRSTLSVIPTVPVTSSILAPASGEISLIHEKGQVPAGECSYHRGKPLVMEFRTSFGENVVRSESLHYLPSGVIVRTSPFALTTKLKGSLDTSKFTRTLRTTQSRSMVQRVLGTDKSAYTGDLSDRGDEWVNGQGNVWIVGSWCWDGLVLLEGCVISSMKVAKDFGVHIPWDAKQ